MRRARGGAGAEAQRNVNELHLGVDAVDRPREHPADHRLEEVERRALIGRVERCLIVLLAEFRAGLEMRMPAKILADVAVHPEMVEEIIALEGAVLVGDPVQLLAEIGRASCRERV